MFLMRRDPTSLSLMKSVGNKKVVDESVVPVNDLSLRYLRQSNALYQLARRYCVVLNQPYLVEGLLDSVVHGLVFVTQAMYHNPELSESASRDDEDDDTGVGAGDVGESIDSDSGSDDESLNEVANGLDVEMMNEVAAVSSGANWVMQRLRNIGSDKRGLRRLYALKVQPLCDCSCRPSLIIFIGWGDSFPH